MDTAWKIALNFVIVEAYAMGQKGETSPFFSEQDQIWG